VENAIAAKLEHIARVEGSACGNFNELLQYKGSPKESPDPGIPT
jgi:hypothetical protein